MNGNMMGNTGISNGAGTGNHGSNGLGNGYPIGRTNISGGQNHHLTRYSSSPALSVSAQQQMQSNLGPFVTPRNSFDSLGSLRPFSNVNSIVNNPWSSSYATSYSNARDFDQLSGNSLTRHNSVISSANSFDTQYDHANAFDSFDDNGLRKPEDGNRLSTLLNTAGVSPQRPSHRHSQLSLSSSVAEPDVSTLQHVDPAIERAFRNMAKSIEDKVETIDRLTNEIEAVLAAVSVGGSGAADVIVTDPVTRQKMDGQEMAHRMVTKLKSLKQENEYLGKMLSQGRAAQKEVEIGILRRENIALKAQLDAIEKQSARTTPVPQLSPVSAN